MSYNGSSSSLEEPVIDESTQTADTHILNQNVAKGRANHDKSLSTEIQASHEPHQTTSLDENKTGNPSASEHDDTTNAATTQILDSVSYSHEVEPTETFNTLIAESDATRDIGIPSSHEVEPTETFNTLMAESDATRDIGIPSSPIKVQPTIAHETSTDLDASTPDLDSDANTTILIHDLSPSKFQPIDAPETSTIQDPLTTSPPEASPTSHDSSEISTTTVTVSNQEYTLITQMNTPETQNDTNIAPTTNQPILSSTEIQEASDPPTQMSTSLTTNNDIATNVASPNPDQERKQLENLIKQELEFVRMNYPKLGKHQAQIKKEADDVSNMLRDLLKPDQKPCELKELKDLKKIVTKLKLQIPAKYRTYDENDQLNNHHFRGHITSKLMKNMPQWHNRLFHETSFCKTIQQRYYDLSSELKLCLLCFAVFPENATISRRLMVYLWIGEGLISPVNESAEKTIEEYGNDLFEKLMEEDFIEPISKKHGCNVAVCKMHPMVRAALVMIADKVNFFDFDEYGNPKDFGKFDEIESPEDVPVVCPLVDPREFFDFFDKNRKDTTEAIAFTDSEGNPIQFASFPQDPNLPAVNFHEENTRKKYYFYKKKITTKSYKVCLMGSGLSKGVEWEKLHMLFNVKDDILEFKPEWFLRMKNVNIVFLGRWQSSAAHHIEVEEFKFEESLEHMKHVRFFSLQGVSRISELPKSISSLESLLILDLRACHNLEVIPKSIGSLKYLTHLDMSECYLLEHMPKEIASLESLQVLKGFVVVESPGRHTCTLHNLKKLENLRKLSMYTHMKEFPQETHLDALQKFETLRKLTILWGNHESNPKTDKAGQHAKKEYGKNKDDKNKDSTTKDAKAKDATKKDYTSKLEDKSLSGIMKRILRKPWVKGSMRRMNAFNNSTLGSRLEKLDLKCFPNNVTPNWLTPGSLKGLKKLYIRGGKFSDLGQYQDILEWDDSPIPPMETWNVEVLRLKYLEEVKMDWRELKTLFPNMRSLEKVKCPRLTSFPCNERGFWTKETTMTTLY